MKFLQPEESIHLWVLGSGVEGKRIEEIVEKYHLQDRVSLIGLVSQQEVANYVANATALVVSLPFSDSVVSETIPSKLVTSLGCGKPIIAAVGESNKKILMAAKGSYFTTNKATVKFADDATPTFTPSTEGNTTTQDNLMFKVPTTNLTDFSGHNVIPQLSDGKYSESTTVYYPVAQPTDSKTGFTFHISYRIIAEDNNEVITVHNATVFVPAKDGDEFIAAWQPNNKYTYTFKITKNSTGTTNPETPIDPIDPTTSTTKGLYPIVFDGATIEDYTEKTPESDVSKKDTKY